MKSRRDSTAMHPTNDPAAAAEHALRKKLVEPAVPTQQAIAPESTIVSRAALWLKYLRDEVRIQAATITE